MENNTRSQPPALEAIDDLQRLKGLRREAAETPSLEAFLEKV